MEIKKLLNILPDLVLEILKVRPDLEFKGLSKKEEPPLI